MTNEEVRNALADTALKRVGMTRQELNYKCEETCAEGATDVLKDVARTYNVEGLDVGDISCNKMYANMSESPYWYEPDEWMTRGDYIFFDWNLAPEEKPLDHVGICLGVEGNMVQYVNINGNNHDEWTIQHIQKDSRYIAYWLRYLNPTPRPTYHTIVSNSDIYDKIHRLQELRVELDVLIQDLFNLVCKK